MEEEEQCYYCDKPQGSVGQNFSGTCGSRECEREADEAVEVAEARQRSDGANPH